MDNDEEEAFSVVHILCAPDNFISLAQCLLTCLNYEPVRLVVTDMDILENGSSQESAKNMIFKNSKNQMTLNGIVMYTIKICRNAACYSKLINKISSCLAKRELPILFHCSGSECHKWITEHEIESEPLVYKCQFCNEIYCRNCMGFRTPPGELQDDGKHSVVQICVKCPELTTEMMKRFKD